MSIFLDYLHSFEIIRVYGMCCFFIRNVYNMQHARIHLLKKPFADNLICYISYLIVIISVVF